MDNSTQSFILQDVSNYIRENTTILGYISTTSIPITQPITRHISFSWYDYAIFCTLLSVSLGIGVFFGCFGKKQNTKEYLLAGGNMKVFPVVVSLVASHTSGISLLGLPAEVYNFGANYYLIVICLAISAIATTFIYLPVFYKLQLTSTYEYLGVRFDKRIRKLASVFFMISVFTHIPIVTYIPSMALASATGLGVHVVSPIVCGICILYTAIGGLKALMWSDTLQFSLTVGASAVIMGLALYKVGGVQTVFEVAYRSGRLDLFNFEFDLTKRDPFWTVIFGFTCHWIAQVSIHQGCMQRFLSVGTFKESKLVVFFFCCVGLVLVKTICVVIGLTMYTTYADCDPLTSKKIRHSNELVPYFILDVAGKIPGLPGLFIVGVFCASLSALSSNLNSLAATIYEDFVKLRLNPKTQKHASLFLKAFVVITGVISTGLVYIVEHLGGLLSLSISLAGVFQGPLLGLFTLGMIFPRANANGAFIGAIVSAMFNSILVFGSYYLKSQRVLVAEYKPVSVAGCSNTLNETIAQFLTTTTTMRPPQNASGLSFFTISFYWYALMGATICIVVGLLVSYISKEQEPTVARELLSPVIYGLIDENKYVDKMDLDYDQVAIEPEGKGRRMSKWEENRQERLRKASYISEVLEL